MGGECDPARQKSSCRQLDKQPECQEQGQERGRDRLFEEFFTSGKARNRKRADSDKKDSCPQPESSEKPKSAEAKEEGRPLELIQVLVIAGEAETGLKETHKDLKVTRDGSAPRQLAYRERFRVGADKTPLEIARDQLGPKANEQQIKLYAGEIVAINKLQGNGDQVKISAGSEINLPGQTKDGGIFHRRFGKDVTRWQDGSSREEGEDGQSVARFRNKDGADIEIKWNYVKSDTTTNVVTQTSGNERVEASSDGSATRYRKNGQGDWEMTERTRKDGRERAVVESFDPLKDKDNPSQIKITDKDNNVIELKPGEDGEYHGNRKDASGRVVDADVRQDADGNTYSRSVEADKSVTRRYEDGAVRREDSKENVIYKESKDDWGRLVKSEFMAGEDKAHTITIVPRAGELPIKFTRTDDGRYVSDYLSATGERLGTVQREENGQIIYENEKTRTVKTELQDGTTVEKTVLADGGRREVTSKDGDTVTVDHDWRSPPRKVREAHTYKEGGKLTKTYTGDGKTVDTYAREESDGSRTELRRDKNSDQYVGERRDRSGRTVESVVLNDGILVYKDARSGATRAELIGDSEQSPVLAISPRKYDLNAGSLTIEKDDGTRVVESVLKGRSDEVKGGEVNGTTVNGDVSWAKGGAAYVRHADGTGVRLNQDGTIDRWGPKDVDNASGEKLSPLEKRYMERHSDIDRRDLAEIHRRLQGDHQQLDTFYKELEKVDSAGNLSALEKTALRRNLMHHVAFPAEINQGKSPTCNATVLQRDLAIELPAKYVSTVIQAISEGQIKTADNKTVPLDPANLKMSDSSGRDLASRIYQTATIQAAVYPQREFRNSEDGVGRLYPVPFKLQDKPSVFDGLSMTQIADARYKLTGEQRAIATIASVDDLLAAFEKNGGRPMIIGVAATKAPFDDTNGGGGAGSDHVVTITHIEKGPPVKVFVQNQWGLGADHSTPETALDADVLVENMKSRSVRRRGSPTQVGEVLIAGDHTKVYKIEKGQLVEDPLQSSTLAKDRSTIYEKPLR